MKRRRKIVLVALAGFVALFFMVIATLAIVLDSIIKSSVESAGPKMTRTEFTLEEVDIQLLRGMGRLTNLRIGNPANYEAEFAMKIDEAVLDIHAGTFLRDKLVVESIQIVGPEITFEGGRTENNLKDIAASIAEYVGSPEERQRLDRRLQVNHFLVEDAKIHLRLSLLGKREITIVAPRIELHDLGTGPDGVTSAELTELIIEKLSNDIGGMTATILRRLGNGKMEAEPLAEPAVDPGKSR